MVNQFLMDYIANNCRDANDSYLIIMSFQF